MESTLETKVKRFEKFAKQHKKNENWKKAIEAYTQVIKLLPGRRRTATYLSRADCYCSKKDWIPARLDCKMVLKQDPSNAKAHQFLGKCLREMGEFPEGVKELEKALEMAKHQSLGLSDVEEIMKELHKAIYAQWNHKATKRMTELENLRLACQSSVKAMHMYNMRKTRKIYSKQITLLNDVFSSAVEAEKPKKVPDVLRCPFSHKPLHDPVTTEHGSTYDHFALSKHFFEVGNTDPLSKQPVNALQLIPNVAMRQGVEDFLLGNEGAYYEDEV